MNWLTPKDWGDLRFAGMSLFAILLIAPLISLLLRWRRKEPLFGRPKWREMIDSSGLIVFIILMGPLGDIAKRHGWPKDVIFVASLLVIGALSFLSLRGHKKTLKQAADAHGVVNPAAALVAKVPPSAEEKQLNRKAWIGLAVFALLAIGLMTAMIWAMGPLTKQPVQHNSSLFPGLTGLLVVFVLMGMLLFAMLYAMIGRWPGTSNMTSSVDIAATPEQVWDKLAYRECTEHWRGVYSRVERLAGPGEAYQLHYLTSENCGRCRLPKVPESESVSTRIEVLEACEPSSYKTRSFPKGPTQMKGDASGWMDSEEQDFTITRLPGGGSRVVSVSRVERPKMWLFLMMRFGSPVSQQLESLKAHLEGQPDKTIYGTQVARIAAARAAPVHCGCPA
jgi:uncharacterized membrane protein